MNDAGHTSRIPRLLLFCACLLPEYHKQVGHVAGNVDRVVLFCGFSHILVLIQADALPRGLEIDLRIMGYRIPVHRLILAHIVHDHAQLAIIRTAGNGLKRGGRRGIRIILNESRRLSTMVEELLEFSRIEDGRFTLSVEPLDLKAELEDAVYTYREFFRKEGIALEYTECPEEMIPISGDPGRLRQVFCNLLDNAAKHGGSGKRIDVSIAQEGGEGVIRIRDYGPGIPPEELPHVKYKFYKGSSKARGSGIGLAVCEEIITRHEGTLDIGNAEGGGCLVTIRLPIET